MNIFTTTYYFFRYVWMKKQEGEDITDEKRILHHLASLAFSCIMLLVSILVFIYTMP